MWQNKNQNAIKHGAFADIVILPDEDPKEWEELIASLNDEWNPEGPSEKDIINSIAMGIWRKRRFRRHLQKLLAAATMPDIAVRRKRQRYYERLVKVLEELDLEVVGCVTEENLSDKLDQRTADAIKRACPRESYDSDSAWQLAVASLIESILENSSLMTMATTQWISKGWPMMVWRIGSNRSKSELTPRSAETSNNSGK